MPELPDISLYIARLQERILGQPIERARFFSPFVLRSVGVSPKELEGKHITQISRLGKRIVLELEDDLFVVIHLMIAGRLQWQSPPPDEKKALGKVMLAAFRFPDGQLSLVEFGSKKRAAIYLLKGRQSLEPHKRGGLDVLTSTQEQFTERIKSQNRTLKRLLTDPATFDGIGNAYSDEVLFHAKLSPVRLSGSLTDEEIQRLRTATQQTLTNWTNNLKALYPGFPKPSDITAFRPDFATHGRYNQPCPTCGSPIQRIVHAENETNYCAKCQNEGRLLADRSLSRLLKDDWPKTLEEMLEGS